MFFVGQVYILGPLEVPSTVTSKRDFIEVVPSSKAKRTFNLKDIENQPEVGMAVFHNRRNNLKIIIYI